MPHWIESDRKKARAFVGLDDDSPELPAMDRIKVLFLASNPLEQSRLALDEEARAITAEIRSADHRDAIELITAWAARRDDLQQLLLQHKPNILHFSGHGTRCTPNEITPPSASMPGRDMIVTSKGQVARLVFMGEGGHAEPMSEASLVHLLGLLQDNLYLVLLGACHSDSIALALAEVVPYAIGMSGMIADDTAIAFAAAFYRGLGFGRNLQVAFNLGENAMMNLQIPDDQWPRLYCRHDTVIPAEFSLVGRSSVPSRASTAGGDRDHSDDGAIRECAVKSDDWNKDSTKSVSAARKYDVFVSYSSHHWDLVEPLVNLLKVGNRYVFQDIKEIRPGDDRQETIFTALRGAKKVVVIWCSHAKESRHVERETTVAVTEKKKVIPVVIDSTPLPDRLKQFQWVDFSSFMRHEDTPRPQKRAAPAKKSGDNADYGIFGIPLNRTGCLFQLIAPLVLLLMQLIALPVIFLIGRTIVGLPWPISLGIAAIVWAGFCIVLFMKNRLSRQRFRNRNDMFARIVMEELRKLDFEIESDR
jgi:hypothetical protein